MKDYSTKYLSILELSIPNWKYREITKKMYTNKTAATGKISNENEPIELIHWL